MGYAFVPLTCSYIFKHSAKIYLFVLLLSVFFDEVVPCSAATNAMLSGIKSTSNVFTLVDHVGDFCSYMQEVCWD